MKKDLGAGTSVLSLCLRASAAGAGFRRSTARTWVCQYGVGGLAVVGGLRCDSQRKSCGRLWREFRHGDFFFSGARLTIAIGFVVVVACLLCLDGGKKVE